MITIEEYKKLREKGKEDRVVDFEEAIDKKIEIVASERINEKITEENSIYVVQRFVWNDYLSEVANKIRDKYEKEGWVVRFNFEYTGTDKSDPWNPKICGECHYIRIWMKEEKANEG
jgi:hypothetical protein